jgi:hypothetical protein
MMKKTVERLKKRPKLIPIKSPIVDLLLLMIRIQIPPF